MLDGHIPVDPAREGGRWGVARRIVQSPNKGGSHRNEAHEAELHGASYPAWLRARGFSPCVGDISLPGYADHGEQADFPA